MSRGVEDEKTGVDSALLYDDLRPWRVRDGTIGLAGQGDVEKPMAVEVIGSAVVKTSDVTTEWSQALTVPADAALCLVLASGYYSGAAGANAVKELNWDGDDDIVDFALIGKADYTGFGAEDPLAEAYYYLNPPTGDQILYGRRLGVQGWTFTILFLKNVKTGTPIGSTEVGDATEANKTATSRTSSLATVDAGDLGVMLSYAYKIVDADPAGYGQTVLNESLFNTAGNGVGVELGEAALRMECTAGDNYTAFVAFAVKAAAGGGVDTAKKRMSATHLLMPGFPMAILPD